MSLGVALVAGRNRVPRPAAGTTALVTAALFQAILVPQPVDRCGKPRAPISQRRFTVNSKLAADKAERRRIDRWLGGGQLGPPHLAAAGRSIRDAVLELPETQMAGTVAGYWSIGAEPDTHGLLFALLSAGTLRAAAGAAAGWGS